MELRRRNRAMFCRAAICFALLPAIVLFAAKPKAKKGDDSGAEESVGDGADTLPASLRLASMRVSAMDTLYLLDLSKEQLAALREAAAGAAEDQRSESAPANKALRALFIKLQAALEAGNDDASISSLRNQVVELVNSKGIELDDTVRPTSAAHAAAAKALDTLKASQLAAYIAAHADDVGDPIELMNDGLTALREAKAATQPNSDEADDIASETSSSVAVLVAGMDGPKAATVAERVTEWLKSNAQLSEADFNANEKKRDAEAREITGSIGPSDVLEHWLQEQMAVLLSNPQAIRAIDLMAARRKSAE